LTTITYGTTTAPFLTTRCLKQLAIDEFENFRFASKVLEHDFYVDDLMSGASSIQVGIKLYQDLSLLASKAQLQFCKWSSNSPEILSQIPKNLQETSSSLKIDTDDTIKDLGVQWNPITDVFHFELCISSNPTLVTKRIVLSELAKVFDPLGFVSPTTIQAKITFQDLWKISPNGWDDPLPDTSRERWYDYQKDIQAIKYISISRCIIFSWIVNTQ